MPRHQSYCSFCGKSKDEVERLIAGPGIFVCNECIDLMHEMVHDQQKPPHNPLATRSLADFKAEARKRGLLVK